MLLKQAHATRINFSILEEAKRVLSSGLSSSGISINTSCPNDGLIVSSRGSLFFSNAPVTRARYENISGLFGSQQESFHRARELWVVTLTDAKRQAKLFSTKPLESEAREHISQIPAHLWPNLCDSQMSNRTFLITFTLFDSFSKSLMRILDFIYVSLMRFTGEQEKDSINCTFSRSSDTTAVVLSNTSFLFLNAKLTTSAGLKYFVFTRTRTIPVLLSFPTSATPSPSHLESKYKQHIRYRADHTVY